MPPTKTTRFGLLKPSVGGDNNQWGDTLNQTLDQVDQLLAVTGTPVVADTVARDLLFPVPVVDDVTIVKSLGYQMRFGIRAAGGPNTWLPEGVLRSAGPLISAGAKGAYADGATDDSNVVTLLSGGVPASGIDVRVSGIGEWDPGTYLINGNVTLDGHHRFNQGATLKVAAGKALTVAATAITESEHQIYDQSLGGTVSLVAPRQAVRFEWFGAKFDSVTDDGPAFQRAFDACPDGTHFLIPPYKRARIATTIHLYQRADLVVFSPHRGLVNLTASLFWDGAYGGRMFERNRCYNCVWDGVNIEMVRRGTVVVYDANITAGQKNVTLTNSAINGLVHGQKVIIFGAGTHDATWNLTDALLTTIDVVGGTTTFSVLDAAITTAGPVRLYVMPQGSQGYLGFTAIDDCGTSGDGYDTNGIVPFGINGKSLLRAVDTRNGSNRVYSGITPFPRHYHGQRTIFYPDMVGRRYDDADAGIVNATITQVIGGICAIVSLPATSDHLSNADGSGGYTTDAAVCPGGYTLVAGVVTVPYVTGASTIGTQNRIYRTSLWCQCGHPNIEQWRISCDSMQNHEFYASESLDVNCGNYSFAQPVYGVASIGAGSNAATSTGGWGTNNPLGKDIEIEGAGVGGAVLRTIVSAYNTGTGAITTRDAASTGVAAAAVCIGRIEGIGVRVGASPNAHGHRFVRTTYANLGVVFHMDGGGFDIEGLYGATHEHLLWVRGISRNSRLHNPVSEGGSSFIEGNFDNGTLSISSHDITCNQRPNGVQFRISAIISKAYVSQQDGTIGMGTVDGVHRKVYDHSNMVAGEWYERNIRYLNGPLTLAQVGYKTVAATGVEQLTYEWLGVTGVSDLPSSRLAVTAYDSPGIGAVVAGGVGVPAIRGTAQVGSNAGPTQGLQGKLSSQENNSAASSTSPAAAVEGLIDVTKNRIDQPANAVGAGIVFEATSSGNGPSTPSAPFHLFHGYASNYNGLTPTIPRFYGMRLEAQFVDLTRTPDVRAFWQEGINDPNLFSGLSTFGSSRVEHGTIYIDIAAAGNATPNAAGAEEYRYRIAGAATVNNPTGVVKGTRFKLVIFNNTAGAITPTLGAAFLGTGFGAIGAGKSRSRDYMYDDVRAALEPIGAVSEDF